MGAAETLVTKVPTADLETLTPQRPNEESYGITFENIDNLLEEKEAFYHDSTLPRRRSISGRCRWKFLRITPPHKGAQGENRTLLIGAQGENRTLLMNGRTKRCDIVRRDRTSVVAP
nr:hypothetical protein [Caballeronia pedi]